MINNTKDTHSKLVPGVGRVPFPAYHGDEPYIFISYAHADHEIVFPLIKEFHDRGYHIWYDEGIAPGNEWTADIAKALRNCTLFLAMITPNSVASGNVKNEINFAIAKKIPFLAIHLKETVLPDDLELQIGTKQAILKHNMTQDEFVYKYTNAFARFGLTTEEREDVKGPAEVEKDDQTAGTSSSKKPLLIAAGVILLAAIAGGAMLLNKKPATETTSGDSQNIDVTYETDKDDSNSNAAEENNQEETTYTFDDSNDSEGVDNYLYDRKYNGVNLTKYFGTSDSVVKVPEVIDGYPVTVISDSCFEDHTEIEEVILPETVTSVRYRGFYGCTKLSKINIPKTLEAVGGYSFASTAVTEFNAPAGFKTLEYGAFHDCYKLENVVLTDAITFIDRETFSGCSKLNKITIPSKDIDIDIKAFDARSKNLTICGVKGSYAEKYATAMEFAFEEYK